MSNWKDRRAFRADTQRISKGVEDHAKLMGALGQAAANSRAMQSGKNIFEDYDKDPRQENRVFRGFGDIGVVALGRSQNWRDKRRYSQELDGQVKATIGAHTDISFNAATGNAETSIRGVQVDEGGMDNVSILPTAAAVKHHIEKGNIAVPSFGDVSDARISTALVGEPRNIRPQEEVAPAVSADVPA